MPVITAANLEVGGTVGIGGTADRPLNVYGSGNPFKVETSNTGRQLAPIIIYRNKAGGASIGDEAHIPFNFRDAFGNDTPHCELGYYVDAAPGVNSVPLAFQVKTGAEGTGGYERYRITSAGHHIFGGAGANLGTTNPTVELKGATRGLNFEIQNENPAIVLYDRDGAADNKTWEIFADGEALKFNVQNDAKSTTVTYLQVERTGTAIDSIGILSPLVQIGGMTSSFPALKRSGTVLLVRLANDSADADLYAGSVGAGGAPVNNGGGTVTIGGNTRTTIGANGAASALTANPVGYIDINVAGTNMQIPYYTRGA